jgi:NADH-quinone oxidoreductase subunit E
MGTACFVKNAENILEEFKSKLHIKEGNTSEDGMYTINTVRCVGACGLAPVVIVDGKVHGRVTTEDVENILKETKEAEASCQE